MPSQVVCVAARLALADSNQAEQDWNKTKSWTREAELQDFITKHPDSKFADLASRRIDELAWEKVNKNDPDAVKNFVLSIRMSPSTYRLSRRLLRRRRAGSVAGPNRTIKAAGIRCQ